jgi:hypothetical protein
MFSTYFDQTNGIATVLLNVVVPLPSLYTYFSQQAVDVNKYVYTSILYGIFLLRSTLHQW